MGKKSRRRKPQATKKGRVGGGGGDPKENHTEATVEEDAPPLWPVTAERLERWSAAYDWGRERALPLKQAGNVSYRKGDLAEALALYERALSCFDDRHNTFRALRAIAMAGIPRLGAQSPARGVAAVPGILERVGRFLSAWAGVGKGSDDHPEQRLAAEVAGNASLTCLKLGRLTGGDRTERRGALFFARLAGTLDPTYVKHLHRMATAARAIAALPDPPKDELVGLLPLQWKTLTKTHGVKADWAAAAGYCDVRGTAFADTKKGLGSLAFASCASKSSIDPVAFKKYVVHEQLDAFRRLERFKSDKYAWAQRGSFTMMRCSWTLSAELAPILRSGADGPDGKKGQWLQVSVQMVRGMGSEMANIRALHLACADKEHGETLSDSKDGPDLPGSPRAIAFSARRLQELVANMRSKFGIKSYQLKLGRGLTKLKDASVREGLGLPADWPGHGCLVDYGMGAVPAFIPPDAANLPQGVDPFDAPDGHPCAQQ